MFDSKSSGPSSNNPKTLKCLGVATDNATTSPTASWNPGKFAYKYFNIYRMF